MFEYLKDMPLSEKVEEINKIRSELSSYSPFKNEPIDFVKWVPVTAVQANDYNPNSVAPPEMELLRHSINNDGYTQPVVTWENDSDEREVIDGFHRTRVCREFKDVQERVHSFLPVVTIKKDCEGRNDRIASTIRHNRARGKHNVDSMSDIVIELKKRNWTDKRIAKELGMDQDEILRLCQVSGLTELFVDDDFTKSWDIGIFDENNIEHEFEGITKDVDNDNSGRIYHTFEKWECQKNGFYENIAPRGLSKDEAEKEYADFLRDSDLFADVLSTVITDWKYSCEHYLSNENMNRIAWLGQASACYSRGLPACFRGGYNLLTESEQVEADRVALVYLNKWLKANDREELEANEASSKTESNLY
jgi:ParB-like chromosome segregation protein Spo0J